MTPWRQQVLVQVLTLELVGVEDLDASLSSLGALLLDDGAGHNHSRALPPLRHGRSAFEWGVLPAMLKHNVLL